jgi:hypothetical protein
VDKWTQRFGAAFIASAFVWVVLRTVLQGQVSDEVSPSPDLVGLIAFLGGFALACFGATVVTVLMQWSRRLEQSELAKHWREPGDTR